MGGGLEQERKEWRGLSNANFQVERMEYCNKG